ncbi:hypothetical protein [Acinetobacter sp. HY1485]|uniref:hypothetical protein n=1 Tax=Acinetobacter sp. HY1485 TaxID=2970918 RepID=UPI0022B9C083|nr:hypothetical protein [Acinetobacter sp. HY1485]
MTKVVKPKNLDAFRLWLTKLCYEVKDLDGGFVARAQSKEARRTYKKSQHYIRVGKDLSGNQAAKDLGREFEEHLIGSDYLEVKL